MWSPAVTAMDYLPEANEKRTEQVTVRVPKSVKVGVAELADFWSKLAQARTGNPDVAVSESDVVVRLLQVGLAGSWGEVGGKPDAKSEWAALIARLVKKSDK